MIRNGTEGCIRFPLVSPFLLLFGSGILPDVAILFVNNVILVTLDHLQCLSSSPWIWRPLGFEQAFHTPTRDRQAPHLTYNST